MAGKAREFKLEFDKDFFDFCYDQYKVGLADAEVIFQKVSVLLGSVVLLGGIAAKMTSPDLLLNWCNSGLHLTLALSTLLLAVFVFGCIVHMFMAVYPRTYDSVAPTAKWQEWKQTHASYSAADNEHEISEHSPMTHHFEESLISALTEAQMKNVRINELRRSYYQRAVFLLSMAAACTLVLALSRLFLLLGGIR